MKRTYYLIFYVGENKKGKVYGSYAFEFKSVFPNRKETTDYIIEHEDVDKLIITNIIRLSKAEYNEWTRIK